MAGTTSQLGEWILKGVRLQDSLEQVSFGAASFQPHLVQAEQCAPHWDAGHGAPQLAVLPPLAGHASSTKQRSHWLSRAAVQAGSLACTLLARLPSARLQRFPPVGAQKPLPPLPPSPLRKECEGQALRSSHILPLSPAPPKYAWSREVGG